MRGGGWQLSIGGLAFIVKINCQILKIFLSRATGPIKFHQTWHKASQAKGVIVSLNKGPCPFPREKKKQMGPWVVVCSASAIEFVQVWGLF